VLNRFVVLAALSQPLTVYGDGGQTRGLIDIRDTVACIRLAAENPAQRGEFRVFNQMTEHMSVLDIAKVVADLHPNAVAVDHLTNPRVEAESHYYNVSHTGLLQLGLEPHLLSDTLLASLYGIAERYQDRAPIRSSCARHSLALSPTVQVGRSRQDGPRQDGLGRTVLTGRGRRRAPGARPAPGWHNPAS